MVQCLASSTPPLPQLIDGDLGPEGANYANTMVHAWHRIAGPVSIMYTLDTSSEIRHMDLYFYSITSMGIGLPSVTVYRGSTVVEYHIFGNDDITQKDNTRRQILLSLRSTGSSRFFVYTLQFDFENTDVNWLVLSETRLCEFPLQGIYAQNACDNACMHMHVTEMAARLQARVKLILLQNNLLNISFQLWCPQFLPPSSLSPSL